MCEQHALSCSFIDQFGMVILKLVGMGLSLVLQEHRGLLYYQFSLNEIDAMYYLP